MAGEEFFFNFAISLLVDYKNLYENAGVSGAMKSIVFLQHLLVDYFQMFSGPFFWYIQPVTCFIFGTL